MVKWRTTIFFSEKSVWDEQVHLVIFPTIVSNQLWIVLNLLLTLQLSKSNCEFTPLASESFLGVEELKCYYSVQIKLTLSNLSIFSLILWIPLFAGYFPKFVAFRFHYWMIGVESIFLSLIFFHMGLWMTSISWNYCT